MDKNILFANPFSLPNLISLFRLVLAIPIYFTLSNLNAAPFYRYISIALFAIAFISDLLDGYIARKKNCVSEFGKIIDPLADKTLVILIVTQLYLMGEILDLFFWTVILRDVIIFTGGIFITKKIGKVLPSNILGKVTVFTIGSFLIVTVLGLSKISFPYHFLFYSSLILSLLSVLAYALRGIEAIRWKKNESI